MSREPLVLVPGLICDDALWAPQSAALGDVAETQVADVTGADAIDAMAADVLEVAPQRFALAGLSMGGYVALAILRAAPERVTRLALLDTTARADTRAATLARLELIAQAESGRYAEVTTRLAMRLLAPERLADDALIAQVVAMERRFDAATFVRQERAIIGRPDARSGLTALALPTLVLCGDQDAVTPPELSAELAALIPGARLEVVSACGHLSTLERPNEVNAALRRWLSP